MPHPAKIRWSWAHSSAGEHTLHTGGVVGSMPTAPTSDFSTIDASSLVVAAGGGRTWGAHRINFAYSHRGSAALHRHPKTLPRLPSRRTVGRMVGLHTIAAPPAVSGRVHTPGDCAARRPTSDPRHQQAGRP